jgi:heme/copper-type cytochrome/quinol oxidase subunit 4
MPMPLKVLIHMGIGCVVYTIVAFSVGWTGNLSLAQGIIAIVAQLVVAFAIWFIFMMHYKKEARKINERIQAMK